MARYRVDWCIDEARALQEMLDELTPTQPTLRVVSVTWQPKRPTALGTGTSQPGYTIVSECE